jgi:hypothetical protein
MNEMNTKYNETPLYDLQEVIQQYQTQPELLKLILTSKVEEDKRRAEEAKLRAKELDLYLKSSHKRNSAPYIIPSKRSHRQSSSSLSSLSSLSEEEEDEYNSDHQQRRHSAAAAMLAMGGMATKNEEEVTSAYPSPIAEDQYADEMDPSKPRRRREMQAITKIVETRDFPYVDNHFWKNNGNTVQKKTGCKSIYYKCSNSNKVRNGITRAKSLDSRVYPIEIHEIHALTLNSHDYIYRVAL